MNLKVYNHLTREIEEFHPLQEGFVTLYVCGPTVYGDSHIGHAKAYVTFDIVHRYLEYLGNKVRYVQNITDVGHMLESGEDRIAKGAMRDKLEPMEVVERYMRHYFRDMDLLNVKRPDISPRATGHVPEQIEMAQVLMEKGYAYESGGNVYFSVGKWPSYGKLSRRKPDDLEVSRVDTEGKKDPRDFAVWRAATPEHLMQWNSPWGKGFPGWHAECTVMARKYLGLPFDIHGGGLENIFPHNESEIAQCEAAYGTEFARYWILNNMVTVDGTKMGKSLGNSITIRQVLAGTNERLSAAYTPMVVRFFILGSHYRQNTDFTDSALQAAAKGYERLLNTVNTVRQQLVKASGDSIEDNYKSIIEKYKTQFEDAMNNDFNTPQALAALFDFTKEVNILLNNEKASMAALAAINDIYNSLGGDVLGIIPEKADAAGTSRDLQNELVQILIDMRKEARARKDWAAGDAIRDRLAETGVVLEDHPDGTAWKLT